MDHYSKEVLVGRMELDKKLVSIKKEINYSKTKAKNLEDLKNRFSFTQSIGINQFLDPKDNTSKYLPIATQLLAIYNDLNDLNEQLKRNKDQKDILDIKEKFLYEYEILNKKNMPEAEKLNQIFKYFSEYLTNLEKTNDFDLSRSEALKNLLFDLNQLKFINEFGFVVIGRENNYTIKPIFLFSISTFLGLMLGIFVSFSLKVLKKYKKEKYFNKLEVKKSTSN